MTSSTAATVTFFSLPAVTRRFSAIGGYDGQTLNFTKSSLSKQLSVCSLSCTTTSTSSVTVEEDTPSSRTDGLFTSGCKGCGKEEMEKGCNGDGSIQGGIATVPGFGWWPIKAYRPCPGFVASGGRYKRVGQSMDEVAFGKVEKAIPLVKKAVPLEIKDKKDEPSKKKQGRKKLKR